MQETQEKKTILFVDDSQLSRKHFTQILQEEYNVVTACDAGGGLALLRIDPARFSLALIDLRMPEVDGHGMLEAMRQNPRLRDIPAVIITAAEEEEHELRSLDMGVMDYISKASSPNVVLRRVRAVIERAEAQRLKNEQARRMEAEKHEKHLENVLGSVGCGVALVEYRAGKYRYIYVNEHARAFTSKAEDDMHAALEEDFFAFLHPRDRTRAKAALETRMAAGLPFEQTVRLRGGLGEYRWVRVQARPGGELDGAPYHIFTFVDVDEEIKARESMRHMAERDELTGVYNRPAFLRKCEDFLKHRAREKYVLVDLNIERFKVINDVFGKSTGDALLRHIAACMEQELGEDAICGRFDADHFAVCMRANAFDAGRAGERASFSWRYNNTDIQVVLNFGVYEIGGDEALPVERMYDRANLAMQTIKGHYQNHCAYYDAVLRDNMLREQEIRSEMRIALDRRDFVVYLQPVVSLTTNRPTAAEALVRWKHPQKGLISPGEFIPLFEKTDFICELDRYVWHEACHILRERREKGLSPLPISVNVSRRSMYDPNIAEDIDALVREHDVSPALLRLEVTESAYTSHPERLLGNIEKLREKGFLILMDDFGSGYSSLNTLKDIPVDLLKVDMKFLEGFEKGGRVGTIFTSIMRMAKWMSTAVVAEGVETAEQADYLRSVGCEFAQGYFYARPMPLEQFESYMHSAKHHLPGEEPLGVLSESESNLLMGGSELVNRLLSSVFGGVGFYEYFEGRLDILRANAAYYTIMGMTPAALTELGTNVFAVMSEKEKEIATAAIERAVDEKREQYFQLSRYRRDNGAPLYLNCKVRHIGGSGERPLLCIAFTDITPQKLAEERYRLLGENAERLIAYDDIEAAVRVSLRSILEHYKADRAYIYEFDWERDVFNNTYEECAAGVEGQKEHLQGMPMDTLSFWFDDISESKSLYIADAQALDDEDLAKYFLAAQGVNSMLSVPLYSGHQRMIGLIGLDGPRANVEDEDTLLTLGYYITSEIVKREDARREAQRSRHMAEAAAHEAQTRRQYRLLLEGMEAAVFEWEAQTGAVYKSPACGRYAFFTMEEETLFSLASLKAAVHGEDAPLAEAFFAQCRSDAPVAKTRVRMRLMEGGYAATDVQAVLVRDEETQGIRHAIVSCRSAEA